jgi:hypothetical protein
MTGMPTLAELFGQHDAHRGYHPNLRELHLLRRNERFGNSRISHGILMKDSFKFDTGSACDESLRGQKQAN